jgi:hypothetical protein
MPQYIASCLVDIPFSALIPVEEVSDAEAAAELSVAETAESPRGATSSVGSSGVAVVAASILFGATETLGDAEMEGVEADPIAEVEEEAAVAGATSRDAAALSSVGAGGAGTGMPCTVRKRKRDPRVRKRRVYILARNR